MENSIAKMRPRLVWEWSEKNRPLTPEQVSYGSNKLYWWKGTCGHEWQASAKARSSGENCPICSGARIISGINDFEALFPDIASEWSDKNLPLLPSMVRPATHQKVWWRCKLGHEWEASVKSRTLNKTGCPYCSHNKVLPGFNDLASRFPEVAKEWHYEKNGSLLPTKVTAFSNKKVWWRCREGHEWYTHISTRSDGSKCPYCSGIVLLPGYNDLETRYPVLCEEWSVRNGSFLPSMVNEKSQKNVWWKCSTCGHEWKSVIKARVNGLSCPVCAERSVKTGYNDLATTHSHIAAQWDFERNGQLTPQSISAKSMKSVWWICERGHSYKAKISDRIVNNMGCIECEKEYRDILFQLLVLYYAGKNGWKVSLCSDEWIGVSLESYIPELLLAIEPVASALAERREQEVKAHICEKNGITYVRIENTSDEIGLAEGVRKALRKKHIYIYSDIREDLQLIRIKFECWQKRGGSETSVQNDLSLPLR